MLSNIYIATYMVHNDWRSKSSRIQLRDHRQAGSKPIIGNGLDYMSSYIYMRVYMYMCKVII